MDIVKFSDRRRDGLAMLDSGGCGTSPVGSAACEEATELGISVDPWRASRRTLCVGFSASLSHNSHSANDSPVSASSKKIVAERWSHTTYLAGG